MFRTVLLLGSDGWAGGYMESGLAPTQLRVGDVAAVKVVHRRGRTVAVSVDVVGLSRW